MERSRQILNSLLSRLALAEAKAADEAKALEAAVSHCSDVEQAQRAVQEVAEAVQQAAHVRIASVVTSCLRSVFGEDSYTFKIRFSQKRGKTEAELLFCRDGLEADPTTAAGGGVVDVAALALRLSCLMLAQPRRRRLLLLDEPLRFLSASHRPAVRGMVEKLAKDLGVQVVLVTHSPEFVMGKVIEL